MSVEQFYIEQRQAMRPTARTWMLHGLLMLITLATATIAGVLFPFGRIDSMPAIRSTRTKKWIAASFVLSIWNDSA